MAVKYLGTKDRSLKYFCYACDDGLKVLSELKTLIRKFLIEAESLKNSYTQHTGIQVDNEFIMNGISDHNKHTFNIILYNINQSELN